MKKFIISFEYKKALVSAKVLINKVGNILIYSVVLGLDSPKTLEAKHLVFLEEPNGFQLFIMGEDMSLIPLNWNIRLQYLDKGKIFYPETFSLS